MIEHAQAVTNEGGGANTSQQREDEVTRQDVLTRLLPPLLSFATVLRDVFKGVMSSPPGC